MQITMEPGRNCWRVEGADAVSLIVDGQDYFRALREACLRAERLILMIGWDFDFEIEMLPGESDAEGRAPDGFPNGIGRFLDALVERRSGLDIYLLKWSGGALIAPGRSLPALRVKALASEQVHLAFDGRHPIGACHHQKIVVIDDSLAFCGGIDATIGRWDTSDHQTDEPRRSPHQEQNLPPWHDATAILSGPAAAALSELARMRWHRANDAPLDEDFCPGEDRWPESVRPMFRDLPVAIARTEPPTPDTAAITEIEQLYLDSIAAARRFIYLESQYFTTESIARAIARRLQEPDGPEVLVINPDAAHGLVEDRAMHVARSRLMRDLSAQDPHGRLRILFPVNRDGVPIYVHAKICIIDDFLLRVGSSNLDRRSMAFDTEADVALLARDAQDRARIAALRDRLLAEHLDSDADTVGRKISETGSLFAAVDRLNTAPRGLRPITPREETLVTRWLADSKIFDPRYRQSATRRLGLTSRHVMIGGAVMAAAIWLWRRKR
ncbi:MAG: phospholipase D-like domain-containing protein [Paracoccus sp. (in: a-proteobacteria)]|nr:phospholipase D-like domain-containing protein [Paracoccus sp. (in: a-proteobacteria)]